MSIKPGPRLDALIAEKVFGYKTYDTVNPFDPRDKNIYNMSIIDNKNHCRQTLNYSTSIADAWQVVEKIEKDFAIQISSDGDAKIIWYCYLENEDKGVWVNEKADTAPHAICLAALKAVGVEV